jgi:hypothetical protein
MQVTLQEHHKRRGWIVSVNGNEDESGAWTRRDDCPRAINSRIAGELVVFAFVLLASSRLVAQHQINVNEPTNLPRGAVPLEVPNWIPIPMRTQQYWWWRKYGPFDYKTTSSKFRNYTAYNFGATAAAANISQGVVIKLAVAAAPSAGDIELLDRPILADQFNTDARDLETLHEMIETDVDITRIARDFTWKKDKSKWPRHDVGLTDARWGKYRAWFEKLHLQEGVFRTEDFPGAIFFILRSKGLCVAGSSSGYVYSERELTPLTDSPAKALEIEARSQSEKRIAYVFRRLKPNWYAFYESDW